MAGEVSDDLLSLVAVTADVCVWAAFGLQCQPDQIIGRPIGRISSNPTGLHTKALVGALEHLAHGTHLGGLVRPAGIYVHGDPVVCIDQVFV